MKDRTSASILAILLIGLLSFYVSGQIFPATSQKHTSSDSNQEFRERIAALEAHVSFLKAQIRGMQPKSNHVLTIPGSQLSPGSKMPPGATRHDLNGIAYWTIPLAPGQ